MVCVCYGSLRRVRRDMTAPPMKGEKEEFVEVYRCEKPLILDAIGYWIRLNGRQGQVLDVNEASRELSVMFNDDQDDIVMVSFDDRNAEWFCDSVSDHQPHEPPKAPSKDWKDETKTAE